MFYINRIALVLFLFFGTGCDSGEKVEGETIKVSIDVTAPEVPAVEFDKNLLLSKVESLVIAKRYLIEYIHENHTMDYRVDVVNTVADKRFIEEGQVKVGFEKGVYGFYLSSSFKPKRDCYVTVGWNVFIDALLGDVVRIRDVTAHTCN